MAAFTGSLACGKKGKMSEVGRQGSENQGRIATKCYTSAKRLKHFQFHLEIENRLKNPVNPVYPVEKGFQVLTFAQRKSV
jgi:hypothetical protein